MLNLQIHKNEFGDLVKVIALPYIESWLQKNTHITI